MSCANKANQHGSLKALRQIRATLLTPSYWRRYVFKHLPLSEALFIQGKLHMSQHDGKKIYEYARGSQATYEIRGNLIHEYARGSQAVYEIRGSLIHEYARGSQAVYEIRGNLIHEYGRGSQAVYEIR